MNIEKIEPRIDALESRNAFQDDIIEQLNEELSIHQAEIASLKEQLSFLAKRIKDNTPSDNEINAVEPPPPHY